MRVLTLLAVLLLAPLGAQEGQPALLLPEAKNSLFCDCEIVNQVLVAVGERGHIFVGDPATLSVRQIPCPVNQFLTGIAYDGEEHFWVVGHDQLILKGASDGTKWEVHHLDTELGQPLFDVAFLPSGEGLAVGAFGSALHTSDRGKNWVPITLDEAEPHFYMVRPGPGNTFYVAAEFGTLLQLNAQGELIKRFETGSNSTFFGLFVEDEQHIMLFGLRGFILKTEDGTTFARDDADTTATFFDAVWAQGSPWLVGGDGILYNPRTKVFKSAGEERGLVLTSGREYEKGLVLTTTSGLRRFDYE